MPAGTLSKNSGPRFSTLIETAQVSWPVSFGMCLICWVMLVCAHLSLLRLPYFWDEAGYYIPAARDLLSGSLIPYSTPSNAHPPLVMAWLAVTWKLFGQSVLVTRCAMLALAAFSLVGFLRLARTVSNATVALASTLIVALYPVFFAQSSLAQVDLPAAGLTFWALERYFRRQKTRAALWFSLAALAKETAILIPLALCFWEVLRRCSASGSAEARGEIRQTVKCSCVLIASAIPLVLWYAYHYYRTGFVFGNPEFFRYNLQANWTPLRVLLALLLRLWQTVGYLNLFLLTLACIVAMRYPPQSSKNARQAETGILRSRIDVPIQFALLTVAVIYLLAMSVLGGAVLARYLLPIVPLLILIYVSTIWRRMRYWKLVLAIVGMSFVAALFVNPPYGFAPEDNLAYADYVEMHQRAGAFIESHYPQARVLTAWPASDELSRPYLGYVRNAVKVVRIEDFTPEQLMSAADSRSSFDAALIFSTKYRPPHSSFDHFQLWREWKTRFFGFHEDLTPAAAATILGGSVVYEERRQGQWVGVIRVEGVEEARLQTALKF